MNFRWSSAEEGVKFIGRLLRQHDVDASFKVLEIGCGNGRIAINLA